MTASQYAMPHQRSWKRLLFLVIVLGSTLLSAIYYYLIAADQYVTEFRFNLRSASNPMSTASGMGAGAGIGGMSGMNPTVLWDSYAIVQFIESREMASMLQQKINLRQIYSSPKADWFSRLNPVKPDELVAEYWHDIVDPFFDMNTGVISVKVRAFTPEESLQVAQTVLAQAESQVNLMMGRARADSLAYFTQEVQQAAKALDETDAELRHLRNRYGMLDPERKSALTDTSQTRQTEKLSELKARYDATLKSVGKSSPLLPVLKNQISALEAQSQSQQAMLAHPTGNKKDTLMSNVLSQYDALLRAQEIRTKALIAAQQALQSARIERERQQLYLNAFVKPAMPTTSLYPKRLRSVLVVLGFSILAWLLVSLGIHAIYDHT